MYVWDFFKDKTVHIFAMKCVFCMKEAPKI